MKNMMIFLKAVYDNIPMIIAIAVMIFGIAMKVRRFFKQSKEDQTKQLQEQADKIMSMIRKNLLSMVTDAEKDWGAGTGVIKKSKVWEQLMKNQQLQEFIKLGLIEETAVDQLIEDAVEQLHAIIEKNQKAKEAITQ